ncbi:hypothetical protein L4G92_05240 [Neisseria sp. ZJ106]|uniref:Lipoprotein n=1 Tax=Neisseria lisongii TaxID=2912188 RepID=A0AAW5AHC3_9NEIS|nr:hypothetical protein [Neisseria lisongii]MCF7521453.1 hypothetical protein [Neisseria lisongii]MCF7529207.1 hypothetical protein [Neisseria lisongii]WCL72296.1 hypothetical protein PJU73_04130 [Neisseria lisongii]
MTEPSPQTAEERAAATRKAKAKIRTVRIWAWVIMALLLGCFFLSQCALSKPKAKQAVIESCVKNIPFSEKWQADLAQQGLAGKGEQVVEQYCVCVWDEPLEKLTDKQIQSLSSISAEQQLALLGGAAAFEQRDRQCIAALKAE